MNRTSLCGVWVCSLAAAAAVGLSSCGGETGGDGELGEPPEGAVAESAEAEALLSQVREEFVFRVGRVELPLFAEELAALGEGAMLGPSAAVGFLREDGWLVPVVPERAGEGGVARVRLPEGASGYFEVTDARTAVTVRARLAGAADVAAEVSGGYALYRGALPGIDQIQRVTAAGLEDLLRIEAPPAGGREIRYQLELGEGVAGLRLVGGSLEMIDATGAPRLRVAPPFLVDADGARHEAALGVEQCAVDTDPSPPWGRAPVEPGARRCKVVVSWEAGAAYPILLDPDWVQTGTMGTARVYHESVLLSSGYVMVMGGVTTGWGITATAEIFNPAGSGSWASTGNMSDNRYGFGSAVVTYGGTEYIVVAGGGSSTCSGGPFCNQAERWTSAGSWSSAGTMGTRRGAFPLTALTNGSNKAMACGGINASAVQYVAETYNPSSNSWSATSPMSTRRYGHTASGLSSSYGHRVLVVGGRDNSDAFLSSAEKFNPSTSAFESTGDMQVGRYAHTTTTLNDDTVLAVAGQGTDSTCYRRSERWNPSTGTWSGTRTPYGNAGICRHAAVLLEGANSKVVILGGRTSPTSGPSYESWIYDANSNSWSATDDMWLGRYGHTAVRYPVAGSDNDKVLAAGGIIWTGVPTAYAERFTPP